MSSEKKNSNVFKMISREKSQFIFSLLENIYTKTNSRKTKVETIAACMHHIDFLEKKAIEIYGSSFTVLQDMAKFDN